MRRSIRKSSLDGLFSVCVSVLFIAKYTTAHGKKWFCYGNKIRDNKYFFSLLQPKSFAAATKRFVDRTKHFVVVTKYFCYPYFNK